MSENTRYGKLIVKGLLVVTVGLIAIYRPRILETFFLYPLLFNGQVYHIFWIAVVLLVLKRTMPSLNRKMSSGKMFGKNYEEMAVDTEGKRRGFRRIKGKSDSGAMRSALYWIMLLLVMWMWRRAGMLPDVWIYVIVLFFVFMDQFCISVFCPFQWLMQNKCCSTCRINNWGYLMALSPLVFISSFWTYSLLLLSAISVAQWEYLYFRYPERYIETSNANLMCRKCKTVCRRKTAEIN